MKLKIKVKEFVKGCLPVVIGKGEWVDLRASKDIKLECPKAETKKRHKEDSYREVNFKWEMVPLGIAMKLPKGFEAVVVPRSSLFKNHYVIQTNSMGVIDNSYSSNEDEWKFPLIMFENGQINKGERICQFRIQLSQKATFFQKLKWLFSSGIKIVRTEDLGNDKRGGFGSTGRK